MKMQSRNLLAGIIVTALLLSPAAMTAQDVKTFPSYQAAATALFEAVKADDQVALKGILGAEALSLLSSGDDVADANARAGFIKHYQQAHTFTHESADKVTLTVGSSAWPLPFPIVRANGAWHFDAKEGAQEIAYRRIGHNELDAMKVLKALYAAEKQYAAKGHDGSAAGAYASRFVSSPGKQDGLYWKTNEGEPESPAGSLVAQATEEGYGGGKKTPFHGYYFHILKEQGSHASGGAKPYEKNGRVTGFAILAYPAEYGASGVMTFIMGPAGTIYQKDLGQGTAMSATAISAYDPDSSWKVAH